LSEVSVTIVPAGDWTVTSGQPQSVGDERLVVGVPQVGACAETTMLEDTTAGPVGMATGVLLVNVAVLRTARQQVQAPTPRGSRRDRDREHSRSQCQYDNPERSEQRKACPFLSMASTASQTRHLVGAVEKSRRRGLLSHPPMSGTDEDLGVVAPARGVEAGRGGGWADLAGDGGATFRPSLWRRPWR
jgi:hypothetical protein